MNPHEKQRPSAHRSAQRVQIDRGTADLAQGDVGAADAPQVEAPPVPVSDELLADAHSP
jgi:hypothetical protein